jgi:hypothetical protein
VRSFHCVINGKTLRLARLATKNTKIRKNMRSSP